MLFVPSSIKVVQIIDIINIFKNIDMKFGEHQSALQAFHVLPIYQALYMN